MNARYAIHYSLELFLEEATWLSVSYEAYLIQTYLQILMAYYNVLFRRSCLRLPRRNHLGFIDLSFIDIFLFCVINNGSRRINTSLTKGLWKYVPAFLVKQCDYRNNEMIKRQNM